MKDASWYLEKYGESHQNPTNILIHKIFVPLIMFSVIGLLWVIPIDLDMWFLNLGMLLVTAALGFYLTMGLKIFFRCFFLFYQWSMETIFFHRPTCTYKLL